MKHALGLIVCLMALSTGALAQTRDGLSCPIRQPEESVIDFLVRTRPTCEARWQEKVRAGTVGSETHERFVGRCGKLCANYTRATPSPSTAYIAGGVVLVGVGAGVAAAASSSSDKPASP